MAAPEQTISIAASARIVGRSPHAHGCSSASDRLQPSPLVLFLSLAVDRYALDFLSPKSELTNGGVRPKREDALEPNPNDEAREDRRTTCASPE